MQLNIRHQISVHAIMSQKEIRTCRQTSGLPPGHREARGDPRWPVFPLCEACRDRLPEDPAVSFEVAPNVRMIADQILHSPTRVMLCEAVNQGLYNPITELGSN